MNAATEMESPLIFSDSAASKVKSLIDEEGNPDLKLRVFVSGGGCSGFQYGFTFVPHLTPLIRGIHATLYAKVSAAIDLQALFEKRYAGEAFVDVMPAGSHPETRSVRGANVCRIAVHRPQGGDTVVVLSVIDNLVKGAAGQAVQNMNILFGLAEDTALADVGMLP